MGAEVPVWVEVERVQRVWIKSYGVTVEDAAMRVSQSTTDRPTGRTTFERPTYPARVDDFGLES